MADGLPGKNELELLALKTGKSTIKVYKTLKQEAYYMEYIEVSGLKISKFTLGTCQLGYNYGIANKTGQPTEEESFQILKTAIENGVNSFDTASMYQVSEDVLGKFFSSSKNTLKNPVITTKIADFNFESDKAIKESMYNQFSGSLEKMKLSSIPVLMLHHFSDFKKGGEIVIENLKEMKAGGKVGKIGISLYAENDMELVLKENTFEAVQIPMNIFDHRLIKSGVLKEFEKRGIIVFVRSVFLQGLFFLDPENLPEKLQPAKEPLKKLHDIANRAGMGIAQLCTSFIKNLDGVSSLVIGCETVKQVEDNISLMNSPALSRQIYDEIFDAFKDIPAFVITPWMWDKK